MDRLIRLYAFGLITAGLLFIAPVSRAVSQGVTLANPVGQVRAGDLVSVDVRLTNLDQAINAVELNIRYPADRLEIVSISRAQSALTLWPEEPRSDPASGTVRVVGGLPNGLYAQDARLVTLTIFALVSGPAKLSLDTSSSAMFLNDGLGTRVKLPVAATTIDVVSDFTPGIQVTSTTHPQLDRWSTNSTVIVTWDSLPETQYSYAFGPDGQATPDDVPDDTPAQLTYADLADGRYSFTIKSRSFGGEWSAVTQRWFLIDRTPPLAFTIEQLPPTAVNGRQVIAWFAFDAMSGAASSLRVGNNDAGTVTSPLTINPDWRGQTLIITVADLAGHEQSASWSSLTDTSTGGKRWGIYGAWSGLAAAVIIVWFVVRRRQ